MIEAGQGDEALAVLGGQKIDVIVSDIHMPKLDGLQLGYLLGKPGRAFPAWTSPVSP